MRTRQLLLCGLFAALTAVGSLIKIPIPGTLLVLTLQTFFVFMTGLMLRPKYALIAQLVYAALGLAGLPVFSEGGGIAYVLYPSFGFILGFCACAPLLSLLVRKNLYKNTPARLISILAGGLISIAAMYALGVAYMYLIYNLYLGEPKTLGYLIVSATGVFILLDIIKLAAAVPLCAAILRRIPEPMQKG